MYAAFRRQITLPLASTAARLLAPACVVGGLGFALHPAAGLPLVASYAALCAVYAALLYATGGITRADIAAVRAGLE